MQRDVHLTSGCYRAHCNWFVHVNRHIALGGAITQSIFFFFGTLSSTIALEAAITPTSTFGGDQFDITLQFWECVFYRYKSLDN